MGSQNSFLQLDWSQTQKAWAEYNIFRWDLPPRFCISCSLMGSKRLLVCAFLGEIVRCHLSGINLCLSADTQANTGKSIDQTNTKDACQQIQKSRDKWTSEEGGKGGVAIVILQGRDGYKEKDGQIAFSPTPDLVTNNKA